MKTSPSSRSLMSILSVIMSIMMMLLACTPSAGAPDDSAPLLQISDTSAPQVDHATDAQTTPQQIPEAPQTTEQTIVYLQDFNSVDTSLTNDALLSALGWTASPNTTAKFSLEQGQLIADNMANGKLKHSTYVIVPNDVMRPITQNSYTVQMDVTHLDKAHKNNSYFGIILNYADIDNYAMFCSFMKSTARWFQMVDGKNQKANRFDTTGSTYNGKAYDTSFDKPFSERVFAKAESDTVLQDLPMRIRWEVDMEKQSARIFVNDVYITATDDAGWQTFINSAQNDSAVGIKIPEWGVKVIMDNVVVATGIGIPENAVAPLDEKATESESVEIPEPIEPAESKIVYLQDFDSVDTSLKNGALLSALGWTANSGATAKFSLDQGQLIVDNMANGKLKHSTYEIVPEAVMRTVAQNSYTVQMDVTHLEKAHINNAYFGILLNYTDINNCAMFCSFMKSTARWFQMVDGKNQKANRFDTSGSVYNGKTYDTSYDKTFCERVFGAAPSDTLLQDVTIRIRWEVDMEKQCARIFVNDIYITATDDAGWKTFINGAKAASAVGIKTPEWGVKVAIDNIVVATGIGIPQNTVAPLPVTEKAFEPAVLPAEATPATVFPENKVVDLVVFMGHSNMAGKGGDWTKAPTVPEGHGYWFKAISDPTKLYNLCEPFGADEANPDSGLGNCGRNGSMVSAFANAYYENTGVPIVAVFAAQGGTAISWWKPGGAPLNDAINRYTTAKKWLEDNGFTIRHNFMFWCQGESDGWHCTARETYKTKLINIVDTMKTAGIETCFVMRIGVQPMRTAEFDQIIAAQNELCRERDDMVMVCTEAAAFVQDGLMSDNVHYNQEGYNKVGTLSGQNAAYYVQNGKKPTMEDTRFGGIYDPYEKTEPPQIDNIETGYVVNTYINASGALQVYGNGRITLTEYIPCTGTPYVELICGDDYIRAVKAAGGTAASKPLVEFQYYDADKNYIGPASNGNHAYVRIVLCAKNSSRAVDIGLGGTQKIKLPEDVAENWTFTVNGVKYILKKQIGQ